MRWRLAIGSALVAALGTACTSAARTVTGTGTYASIVPHSVEVTPTCTTAQLAPTLEELSAAASQRYTMIRFQNQGVPCAVEGAPDVVFLDAQRHELQGHAEKDAGRLGRDDTPLPSLLIVRGSTANAVLQTGSPDVPSPADCDRASPSYVRIQAPGASDKADLPWTLTDVCLKDLPIVDAVIHGDVPDLF